MGLTEIPGNLEAEGPRYRKTLLEENVGSYTNTLRTTGRPGSLEAETTRCRNTRGAIETPGKFEAIKPGYRII